MKRERLFMRCAIAIAVLALSVSLAAAAEPLPLALTEGPTLMVGVAALPRITAPSTPATARINAALERADERGLAAAKACAVSAGPQPVGAQPAWQRTVFVSMRTDRLVSFVVSDEIDCGGAHPDNGIFALVYNVRTGSPVNLLSMFPKSLEATAASDSGIDDTQLGLIQSPKLLAWFEKSLDTADCSDLGNMTSGFSIWPDPQGRGLTLFAEGVPFAAAPCAGPVTIPYAMLKTFGVSPDLSVEIQQAQTRKLYGPNYSGGN